MYITEDVFQHYTSLSHLRPGSWEQLKVSGNQSMLVLEKIRLICEPVEPYPLAIPTDKHGYPLIVRLNISQAGYIYIYIYHPM